MKRPISFITPFTTLDYPDHLACIVWFSGCNMRCAYCYNPQIVLENGNISIDELLTFLKKRQGLLDGVVLSGGECTCFKDLISLCQKIKNLGYKIKLDTNGSNPKVLKTLLEENLIDFVALDFKAPKEKFTTLACCDFFDNFNICLETLVDGDINFEVRTTVHSDFLNESNINAMIDTLYEAGYKGTYYLQNYLHVETLGNVKEQTKTINPKLLNDKIKIELRNF